MSPAAQLLAELEARGIILEPHGDRLRYRPRLAMTPGLAGRVKANKAELLAMLGASGPHGVPGPEADTRVPEPEAERAIPRRPPDRPGFVIELVSKDGRWSWRQRRIDAADRALLAYRAGVVD